MANPFNITSQDRFAEFNQMRMPISGPAISTGNLPLDMLITSLLSGQGFNAVPGRGQGVYDAMIQQQRSKTYMKFMQQSFGNQLLFQRLGGFNTNTTFGQISSMILGQPDGLMDSKLMRALNGGNPIKAMMGLQAGMTGQTMGMLFGSNVNANEGQVQAMFKGMQDQFYTQRYITNKDVAKMREQNNREVMGNINKSADVKAFFGDALTDDGKSIDYEKIRIKAKEYAEKANKTASSEVIKAYEDVLTRSQGIHELEGKIGTSVSEKVNYAISRGYDLDDLTGSAMMAADLGMFHADRKEGASIKGSRKAGGQFMANAARTLRAVSDLTGTEDAKGAMGELNSLLGNSTINLGDEQQSKEAETLLRRFKGAARAAGISVEAIMGILNVTKALTSQHSALQYMGGMAQIETAIKSTNIATAFSATMGADWVRRQGGTTAVQQQITETLAENKDEPIVKQMGSWASAINQSNLTPAQKEAALQRLSNYAKRSTSFSPAGFNAIADDMARTLGVSKNQVLSIAESKIGQQAGAEFLAERDRQGKGLNLDAAAGSASVGEFLNAASIAIRQDGFQVRGKNGQVLSEADRISEFMRELGNGGKLQPLAQKYGLDRSPLLNQWLGGATPESRRFITNLQLDAVHNNPAYKYELALQQTVTKGYAQEAANLAEKMPKLQAPLLQSMLQSFMSGDFAEGSKSIADLFVTPEKTAKANAMMEAVGQLNSDNTDEGFKKAFGAIQGGKFGPGGDERLAGFDDATEVSKKLTLSQILQAANNFDGSKAKELGLDKEQIGRAAAFLKRSGFTTSDILKRYGDQSFNDTRGKILGGQAIGKVAGMAAEDIISATEKSSQEAFDKTMAAELGSGDKGAVEHANKLQGALGRLGLVKDGHIDVAGAMKKIREAGDSDDEDINTLKSSHILSSGAGQIQQAIDSADKAKKDEAKIGGEKSLNDLIQSLGTDGKAISQALDVMNGLLKSFGGAG